MKYRTGLKPAAIGAHDRVFARGLAPATLPAVPISFGHENAFPAGGWDMLGNDRCGDCAIAGPMHVEMLWNKLAGRTVTFTALDAIEDYGAISGYKPDLAALTDVGCDMVAVAKYWQMTGMRDSSAARHKITAFMSIQGSAASTPDLRHVYLCAYLFGAAGIGITLPDSVDGQFESGQTWTVVAGSGNSGEYHFVPVIARGPLGLGFVTWGRFCWMGEDFFEANCREALVYFTPESLVAGKSPDGIDYATLLADLSEAA